MLYIKVGYKNDMYFVCQDAGRDNVFEIVKVFYSRGKADEYVRDNQRIGARR